MEPPEWVGSNFCSLSRYFHALRLHERLEPFEDLFFDINSMPVFFSRLYGAVPQVPTFHVGTAQPVCYWIGQLVKQCEYKGPIYHANGLDRLRPDLPRLSDL